MKLSEVKNKRAVIYVLVGLPGSGKSTWVQNNSHELGDFAYISTDKHLEDMAKEQNLTYNQSFNVNFKEADKRNKESLLNAIKHNKNIVWDQTNMGSAKRRKILNQIPNNYTKIAVVFSVDDEELHKRLETRHKETGKYISKNVIDEMKNRYEEPSYEEGFTEIRKV